MNLSYYAVITLSSFMFLKRSLNVPAPRMNLISSGVFSFCMDCEK